MKHTSALLLAAAALLAAQSAPTKSVLGTVTEFKVETLEIGVKPDNGAAVFLPFGAVTQVLQVPPGERDLEKAKPYKVTDIASGDRVLVSFVDGLREARRIVVVSAGDIARRNEAERLDWQRRGISGIVSATDGSQVTLSLRTVESRTAAVILTPNTKIRRYAADSVRFADVQPSAAGEIAVGDQFQARGEKSEDGSHLIADEVVYGTFLTKMGAITAVDLKTREIQIAEMSTRKPLSIRLAAGSQIKVMPDMKAMFGAMINAAQHKAEAPHAVTATTQGPPDIRQFLEQLPLARIDDLKVGDSVAISSTRGVKSDRLTAIMILAHADFLLQMAKAQAAGPGEPATSGMDAILRGHGNMLGGPGGISIPAIVQ